MNEQDYLNSFGGDDEPQKAGGDFRAARGVMQWQEGDEPAEATIRRMRDGDSRMNERDTESIKALREAIETDKDKPFVIVQTKTVRDLFTAYDNLVADDEAEGSARQFVTDLANVYVTAECDWTFRKWINAARDLVANRAANGNAK